MTTIKITNEKLYNQSILDIDTTGLKGKGTDCRGNCLGFYGDLGIEKTDGRGWNTTSGEFGENDYKDEFGFILISE